MQQPPREPTMIRLTIGILTLNEERRIADCIASAAFADQIIVVDSGSTDRTKEIAAAAGAEVFDYPDWQGFGEQRNRILRHARGDYVFFLDADERITPELQSEIEQAAASGRDAIWEVRWNQVAYGRPLTLMRSTGGVLRMFRRESIDRYVGVVHEHAAMKPGAAQTTLLFRHRLLHYSRETVHGSLLKLAQYAQLGAVKRAQAGKRGGVLRGLASGFGNFVRLYFFQRGFLCGPQGFLFCLFIALECFFRYAALEYDREELDRLSRRS